MTRPQDTILPARIYLSDGHPITMIPLPGLPHEPELFRPVEEPLGLAPFPLNKVALGCTWYFYQRDSAS